MKTKLDQLHDQHSELGCKLRDLQHKKDCSERPADGTLITIGTYTFASQGHISLSPQEKVALEVEILYTRLDILKLAKEIHQIRYNDVPEWIITGIVQLQRSVQAAFN